MGIQPIESLLLKFRENRCTPEELVELDVWYGQFDDEAGRISPVPDGKLVMLYQQIEKEIAPNRFLLRTLKYAVGVAAVLIFGWFGIHCFVNGGERDKTESESIIPGHCQAELTFADGAKIALDSNSVIRDKKGMLIKSEVCPLLDYTLADSGLYQPGDHTVTVPLGGEFGIILSDGTRVWLNSGSTLKYPVSFIEGKREVILTGEGYFQVAKSTIPFVVQTAGMQIKVLGTSFNVSAYQEDNCVTAALVDGKILIRTGQQKQAYEMVPGDLLSYEKETERVSVEKCNTELYTSWMEGKFRFRDMRLEDIMIKLNRWYDCEFFYQNAALKDLRFSGAAEKDRPIRYLLERIETVTGVRFEIKGRTVVLRQK